MATGKRTAKIVHGRNRQAIEETIAALRIAGRLESVDNAHIAICQSLADAVDIEPNNASLWREYRAAVTALRAANVQTQDEFSSLLASLSAEMDSKTTA